MAAVKTETITVRLDPAVKRGLKDMADRERRSQANMIEVMIRDYCARHGIPVATQSELFSSQTIPAEDAR